ncbi:MAG: methyltransferase domain-containing protein [Sedimentisphaerales bacterium]
MNCEIQQSFVPPEWSRFSGRVIPKSAVLFILLFAVSTSAQNVNGLLEQSGIKGGLIVHLGCSNGERIARLRAGDQYFVHGLDTDPARVAAARDYLLMQGAYGPVSVDRWDGRNLPYADNLVNLIIAEKPENVSKAEMLRVLAPNGVALVRKQGQWEKTIKPWPSDIDEWTHYFQTPMDRQPALVASPRPHGQHDGSGLGVGAALLHFRRGSDRLDSVAVPMAADRA